MAHPPQKSCLQPPPLPPHKRRWSGVDGVWGVQSKIWAPWRRTTAVADAQDPHPNTIKPSPHTPPAHSRNSGGGGRGGGHRQGCEILTNILQR